MSNLIRFLGGIQLTVILLFKLFLLVLFATFAQVDYGIFEANKRYFTSWFVWFGSLPIFLGGYSIGLLLIINLFLSHTTKFKFNRSYFGIFLIHFGLVLIIVGSGLTSFFAKEMQIAVQEGQSINYLDHPSDFEFVIIDSNSDPTFDQLHVYSLDELANGITFNGLVIETKRFIANSIINQRGIEDLRFDQLGVLYKLIPLPKTYKMDERNIPGIEINIKNNQQISTYLLWGGSDIYQELNINGKQYLIKLRLKRTYLPFSLYLDDFIKDDYQGTATAKQFISHVKIITDSGSVPFKIEMNQPLRYQGFTFFQSSFTEDESTSVFQVVKNPSWQLPYISSLLIVIGLFIQMVMSMKRKS